MRRIVALLLLALGGASAPAMAAEVAGRQLQAEPVKRVSWDGSQFVRSDRAGRVFLFRGDRPEVYQVAKGELAEPEQLLPNGEALGFVLNAVLSPTGDRWLVHAASKVRLFENGKEKPLPLLSWQPWTVGFLRDTPLVGVMPRPLPDATLQLQKLGTVPWLVTLDNAGQ